MSYRENISDARASLAHVLAPLEFPGVSILLGISGIVAAGGTMVLINISGLIEDAEDLPDWFTVIWIMTMLVSVCACVVGLIGYSCIVIAKLATGSAMLLSSKSSKVDLVHLRAPLEDRDLDS